MMSLLIRLFIKNEEDILNPNVKKSLCYIIQHCWDYIKSAFMYNKNHNWFIKSFCCNIRRWI